MTDTFAPPPVMLDDYPFVVVDFVARWSPPGSQWVNQQRWRVVHNARRGDHAAWYTQRRNGSFWENNRPTSDRRSLVRWYAHVTHVAIRPDDEIGQFIRHSLPPHAGMIGPIRPPFHAPVATR